MTCLNQSLDLRSATALTRWVTTARSVRADRASTTQEAILKAAGAREGDEVEVGEETLEWQ